MPRRITKVLSIFICLLLIFQQSGFSQIAGELDLSSHFLSLRNTFIQDRFRPLHLRYLSYDPSANNFNLLLDKGDFVKGLSPKGTDPKDSLQQETKTLLNYFFIGISLPNEAFWVNLRPDSPNNIIDSELAETDVGKILLEADLQLKKDTANFTSPQTPEGKDYWDKLYKKAEELYGNENITIPTLTRPWIVPDEIIIRESSDNAYIYKATLKVMLEQDYLKDSSTYSFQDQRSKALNEYSSQLIRETIIPKLTKEINSSKRYAPLRQVYYSLILAQWFKQKFYGKPGVYSYLIDRHNLNGLTSKASWSKTTYFNAYKTSFQQGEYNIKEPVYTPTGQTIRSYMSGGVVLQNTIASSAIVPGSIKRDMFNRDLLDLPQNKIISRSAQGGTASSPFDDIKILQKKDLSVSTGNAVSATVLNLIPDQLMEGMDTIDTNKGILDFKKELASRFAGEGINFDEFFRLYAKNMIGISDYLKKLPELQNYYCLGLHDRKRGLFDALVNEFNLKTYLDAYEELKIPLKGDDSDPVNTEALVEKLVSQRAPVVFFVPRGIFSYWENKRDKRSDNDKGVTKTEMELLVEKFKNNKDALRNVVFVFELYETISYDDYDSYLKKFQFGEPNDSQIIGGIFRLYAQRSASEGFKGFSTSLDQGLPVSPSTYQSGSPVAVKETGSLTVAHLKSLALSVKGSVKIDEDIDYISLAITRICDVFLKVLNRNPKDEEIIKVFKLVESGPDRIYLDEVTYSKVAEAYANEIKRADKANNMSIPSLSPVAGSPLETAGVRSTQEGGFSTGHLDVETESTGDLAKKEILYSAYTFAVDLTKEYPQVAEDGKLNYYLAGSLAPMLLSQAEDMELIAEKNLPFVSVQQKLKIPAAVKEILLQFTRKIGDLDYIPLEDYRNLPFGEKLSKGGGGPAYDDLSPRARKVFSSPRQGNKIMCDPLDALSYQVVKIQVGGKEFYVVAPMAMLCYKVLHLIQQLKRSPEKLINDFNFLLEAVEKLYSWDEIVKAAHGTFINYSYRYSHAPNSEVIPFYSSFMKGRMKKLLEDAISVDPNAGYLKQLQYGKERSIGILRILRRLKNPIVKKQIIEFINKYRKYVDKWQIDIYSPKNIELIADLFLANDRTPLKDLNNRRPGLLKDVDIYKIGKEFLVDFISANRWIVTEYYGRVPELRLDLIPADSPLLRILFTLDERNFDMEIGALDRVYALGENVDDIWLVNSLSITDQEIRADLYSVISRAAQLLNKDKFNSLLELLKSEVIREDSKYNNGKYVEITREEKKQYLNKLKEDFELSSVASPVAEGQDAYVTKPIVAPQEKIIGNIVTKDGHKLYMRQGQEDNRISIVFYNNLDKAKLNNPIGFVDINTQENLINYIYIYKEFRGGSYSGDMLDVVLAKMEDGTFTGKKATFAKAYVRNPLMVKVFKERGFDYIEDARINITVVIPEERSIGKIPIFVENPNDRMVIEKQISDDPEWQGTFKLVDKLEGRECVIFATYIHYFPSSSPLSTISINQEAKNNDIQEATSRTGGIDMRSLPQHTVIQQMATSKVLKQGKSPSGVATVSDKEWQEIERMASSGIAPSCERIREYLLSLEDPSSQTDKVLACIADILRQEEEKASGTESSLRAILVLLESDKPVNELRLALAKVQVLAKEPQLIAQ